MTRGRTKLEIQYPTYQTASYKLLGDQEVDRATASHVLHTWLYTYIYIYHDYINIYVYLKIQGRKLIPWEMLKFKRQQQSAFRRVYNVHPKFDCDPHFQTERWGYQTYDGSMRLIYLFTHMNGWCLVGKLVGIDIPDSSHGFYGWCEVSRVVPVFDCPSCLCWSLVYQGSKNLRKSPTVLFFPLLEIPSHQAIGGPIAISNPRTWKRQLFNETKKNEKHLTPGTKVFPHEHS